MGTRPGRLTGPTRAPPGPTRAPRAPARAGGAAHPPPSIAQPGPAGQHGLSGRAGPGGPGLEQRPQRRRRDPLGAGGAGQPLRQLCGHGPASAAASPAPRAAAAPRRPRHARCSGHIPIPVPGRRPGQPAAATPATRPARPRPTPTRTGPGPRSYPDTARRQPPARSRPGGRADQGTTWYPARPGRTRAASPPASPYPYQQPDHGYPPAADYGPQPGQAGLSRHATTGTRDDMRYRNGQTEDPYGPDGYSGYHSRQG